jgi:hypothetical protein
LNVQLDQRDEHADCGVKACPDELRVHVSIGRAARAERLRPAARGLGLDLADLAAMVRGEELPAQISDGIRMGRLHLFVGESGHGLAFYRDLLGFGRFSGSPRCGSE